MSDERVSIIVNNHNYERFLEDAIVSALEQTYPHTEVIVVDDGSEDGSRAVMEKYHSRLLGICKSCGGQASALNAGFDQSGGEVVIFLDADDRLLPTAAEEAVRRLRVSGAVKVHWPLWVIDENGARTQAVHPNAALPEGDFREEVFEKGPGTLASAPTSGNAWTRSFLRSIGPIPEAVYRISADRYLIEMASFWGSLAAIKKPLGEYRLHGNNAYVTAPLERQLTKSLTYYDDYAPRLAEYCRGEGYPVSLEKWKKHSWYHRQASVLSEIAALPVRPGFIILVDDGAWGGGAIAGWERRPFLEKNGRFAGLPANGGQAIGALERLRGAGAQYIVFAWHTFWWLDVYSEFQLYLREHFELVLESESAIGFDLMRYR